MGASTAIEWTQSTWNPWRGCAKVSPGCASCYMYRDQLRYGRDPQEVVRTKPSTFDAPLRWRNSAEASSSPLVFTCSWSDWFHPSADPWRDDAWSIVKQCPTLTFQILTKRPELIRERLPADWGPDGYSNVWLASRSRIIGSPGELKRFSKCLPTYVSSAPSRCWGRSTSLPSWRWTASTGSSSEASRAEDAATRRG